MYKKTTFLFLLVLSVSFCNAQLITDEMLKEKEKAITNKKVIEELYTFLIKYDTKSVKELKKELKNQLDSLPYRKSNYIKSFKQRRLNDEKEFSSKQKLYTLEEERYTPLEDDLVTDNHIEFKKYIQSKLPYNQTYNNLKSELKIPLPNNGMNTYNYEKKRHTAPYPGLGFHSEKTNEIDRIYYHDGTIDSTYRTEVYSMPLNSCYIPSLKHIDSIRMKFTITYLTKVDTITLGKEDIGKEKMDIEIISINNNYIRYIVNDDDYSYRKGFILEEEIFNKEGKRLEIDFSTSYTSAFKNIEEDFGLYAKMVKKNYASSKKRPEKNDLLNTIKYNYLDLIVKQEKLSKKSKKNLVRSLYKGNIHKIKFYLENKRDTQIFKTTFHNISPVKEYYVHELKENTELIDKNGKVIYVIPFKVNFLNSSKLNVMNYHYFTKKDDYERNYYFLDIKNKTHTKLTVNSFEFIAPSLLMVYDKKSDAYFLRNTIENKNLSTTAFSRRMIYKNEVIMFDLEGKTYQLFDQNGILITEETTTPITKITMKPFSY